MYLGQCAEELCLTSSHIIVSRHWNIIGNLTGFTVEETKNSVIQRDNGKITVVRGVLGYNRDRIGGFIHVIRTSATCPTRFSNLNRMPKPFSM